MTTKTSLLAGWAFILLVSFPGDALAWKGPDKDDIRSAISEFRAHPFTPGGRAAAALIRQYAEQTDQVTVKVTDKLVPFTSDLKINKEDRKLLLSAFIIGSVDSQLLHNEKKDDPYAGVLEVIQTYKRMKQISPTLSLPEIENLMEMETKGELKQYAESP